MSTENESKKKIEMQYPLDEKNENIMYDGKVHEIIPDTLKPIKLHGRIFYVMEYYDVNKDRNAITLLTRVGDDMAKVPLDNYDILADYMNSDEFSEIESVEIELPSKIRLAQTVNAERLFEHQVGRMPPTRGPVAGGGNNPPPRGPGGAGSPGGPPTPPPGGTGSPGGPTPPSGGAGSPGGPPTPPGGAESPGGPPPPIKTRR